MARPDLPEPPAHRIRRAPAARQSARAARRGVAVGLLALLLLALAVARAMAQDAAVGEAVLERGLLKLRRGEAERVYQRPGARVRLAERDVLRTGAETRVTVRVAATGQTVTLYSNTHLHMARLRPEETNYDLNVGKALFAAVQRLLGGSRVSVDTPTVVVGVKGTEFVVGSREDESYVLTLQGRVGVTPKAAPEREVEVRPDELYYVAREEVPAEARPVSPAQRQRIVEEEGLEPFREAAGLGAEPPAEEPEPLGLTFRFGPAAQHIGVRLGGGEERWVESAGLTVALGWRLAGPLFVELMAYDGRVTGSGSVAGDPADASSDAEGNSAAIAALLGLRGRLGASWIGHVAAGPFRSWTNLEEPDVGLPRRTLNLEGGLVRLGADYLFLEDGMAGVSLAYGNAEASGTEVERLRRLGLDPGRSDSVLLSLTLGVRF